MHKTGQSRSTRLALLSGTAIILLMTDLVAARRAAAQQVEQLDEITVTATRRPQADAALPIATTILTPEQLAASAVQPLADIARQSPGTAFQDFGRFGESYMTMRGIGTLGVALNTLDNSVGFSTDGVPTSLSGIGAPMLDIERIEVLRGPQGTTFGRNALGGAINAVTIPADGRRELRLDAEGGTNGHGFVQGTVGGWINPGTLAGRAVVRLQNYNGDVPNIVTGLREGAARIGAARGALRFTPDETLTIDLSGAFSDDQRNNPAFLLYEAPGYPVSGADIRPINRRQIANGTLRIAKQFDTVTLTSVTSYQDIRLANYGDFTDSLLFGRATGLPSFVFNNPATQKVLIQERERIFNQELRLNSQAGTPIQWVVGVNYFRSDFSTHRDMSVGPISPTLNGIVDNQIVSQTIAAFGDVTVPLGNRFELSGGLRIAHDNQSMNGRFVGNGSPGTVPGFAQRANVSDTYVTGRLALSYRWTDRIMTYASLARGYSSGGFEKTFQYSPLGLPTVAFRPATVWTYEVGAKAEIAPGFRVNAALFYNDVRDGQLASFDPATFLPFMVNQNYRSYGIEAGISARIAEGLELTAGGALIKSQITRGPLPAIVGNEVPQVPSVTANLGLNYRTSVAALGMPGELVARAEYQFVGARYSDISNTPKMAAYHMINGKLGWERDNISVYVFARNLLDQRPLSYAFTYAPGATATYISGNGRVIGLGTSIRW